MRKILVAGVTCVALNVAGAANAADLSGQRPAYKAAPVAAVYNWTGFYIGANAGYGWGGDGATLIGDAPRIGDTPVGAGNFILNLLQGINRRPALDRQNPLSLDTHPSGFVGGGQFGYNWQFDPRWVAGVEADIQFSGIKGDAALVQPPDAGAPFGLDINQRLDISQRLEWFGTVRARLGTLLTDRVLAYATGGFAYGETKASAALSNISSRGLNLFQGMFGDGLGTSIHCPAHSVCIAGAGSRTATGWVAGGGIEYAAWNNVTFKVEYLHVDLGSQTVTLVARAPATGNGFVTAKFDNTYDIVRAGLNWKFD